MDDITDIGQIRLLVDTFYGKVRQNETLGPIFEQRIGDKWPEHLNKMYRFWQTVLLNERTYEGSPFPPHMNMPIGQEHFQIWVGLFTETLDQNFSGVKADEAKWRAKAMAEMFSKKLEYIRQSGQIPIQ